MRLPFENWLKYLIASQPSWQNAEICESCELHDLLPVPGNAYLNKLRARMQRDRPLHDARVALPNSAAYRLWLRRHGVYHMASGSDETEGAKELLEHSRLRQVVETLLLAGMPCDEVAGYVGVICKRKVDPEVVDVYGHYFWCRELLSQREWYAFFNAAYATREVGLYRSIYSRKPDYALWRLGCEGKVTSDEAIARVLQDSVQRWGELNDWSNGADTAVAAKMWADSMFRAIEASTKTEDAVKGRMEQLRHVSLRLGRRDISSLADLREAPAEAAVASAADVVSIHTLREGGKKETGT